MTWPTPPSNSPISTEHLDGGTKKPAQARPDLKALVDRVNQLEALLKTVIENGSPMLLDGSVDATGVLPASLGAMFGNAEGFADNVLGWYEQGTFSPTLGSTLSGVIGSYASSGHYVRIGRLVLFSIQVNSVAGGTGAGSFYVTGFPWMTNARVSGASRDLVTFHVDHPVPTTYAKPQLAWFRVGATYPEDALYISVKDIQTGDSRVIATTELKNFNGSGAYFLS